MQGASKTAAVGAALKGKAARWCYIAPTLFLLVVVNQLDKTNIAVVMADPRFLSDMALTGQPTRIGFLSTIFFFGYGGGLMVWGFVVDRLGPRHSAMIGVGGWAATTLWCAMAHGINELYLARFVLGIAEGCIWPVCNTYSARWFPTSEHGRIQSFWVNGNQVGIAVGLPVVAALITAGGWRAVFWMLGAGSFALLEPMLFFLAPDQPDTSGYWREKERRRVVDSPVDEPARLAMGASVKLGHLLTTAGFWLVTLCHAGTVATLFGLTIWVPTYLTQERGLPFDALKGWVAFSYLLPIGVAMGMGYWADRTLRPAMVGTATSAVVAAMVLASVTVSSAIASVLLLVTTLAAPMIYGAMNASLMQRLAVPEHIGRATGIFVGAGNLLGGLAPTVIGYLIGAFGGRYLAAFGFVSATNLVLVALYHWMDRLTRIPKMALAG